LRHIKFKRRNAMLTKSNFVLAAIVTLAASAIDAVAADILRGTVLWPQVTSLGCTLNGQTYGYGAEVPVEVIGANGTKTIITAVCTKLGWAKK
jgi:hypothetical protein